MCQFTAHLFSKYNNFRDVLNALHEFEFSNFCRILICFDSFNLVVLGFVMSKLVP